MRATPYSLYFQCSCLLLTVGIAAAGESGDSSGGKTVRLLTVGNSFSQNATRYLEDLAKAGGHVLIHHPAVIGGATLAQHLEKAELHEKDPQDPRGFYGSKLSLRQELLAAPWDVVTIQQASLRSHDVASYRPYARQLHDYIRKYAPRAKVMMHQTWAYRRDDPRFAGKAAKPGEPRTQEAMYQGLASAYRTIAAELGAPLIPVGDAFHRADTDPQWGYRPDTGFDFASARPPALPNQTHSLHTGWVWSKGKDGETALRMDGHHAGLAGQYLGACVFYETLFGDSVVGNAFVPEGLDPAYARFLQETAHEAAAGVVRLRASQSKTPSEAVPALKP